MVSDALKVALINVGLGMLLNFMANYVAWCTTGIRALRIWALSCLLTLVALGFTVVAQRTQHPLAILLSNAFYYWSFVLVPAGLFSYRARPFSYALHAVIVAVAILALWGSLWLQQSYSFAFRTGVGSLLFASYCLYTVYLVTRTTRARPLIVAFAIVGWGGLGLVNLIRLVLVVLGLGIDNSQPFEGLTYMLALVFGPSCVTGGYIALILIIIQRLIDEKNTSLRSARQLTARYRQLSDHDPLTQALNRRKFMDTLEARLLQARKTRAALSILMIDLDHFKRINDTHGHPMGDAILMHAVKVWSGLLRIPDVLGRMGGEEFAVILPKTHLEQAAQIAERLRAGLKRKNADLAETITASFGVAEARPHQGSDDLLRRADHAMYRAKNGGRDRVVLSDTD